MANKLDILMELERRGKLPSDQKALLDEARRRGLVTAGSSASAASVTPDGRTIIPDTDPRAGLPIPGTVSEYEAGGGDVRPQPPRSFGTSQSDTLNPIPAIAAGADAAVSNIPIAGPHLQKARDQINANFHGDTPADARADMNKNIDANPVAAKTGEAFGKASPWIAAALVGGPLAGALGLEGTVLSRIIWGSASNEAIKVGDKLARGEAPLDALTDATKETMLEAPFFAFGTKTGRQAEIAKAPKTSDLFAEGSRLYDSAKDSKLVIAQPNAKSFIDTTTSKAINAGLDEKLTEGSVSVIKRLQSMADRNMSIDDAMLVRKLANDAYINAKPDSNDARIARQIVRDLDAFLDGVTKTGPQGQPNMAVIAGDPVAAKTALDEANKVWSAASKAKTIDQAIEIAVQKAEESGRSLESTLKTEFGRLDREIIKSNPERFSPDEAKLIREVARGNGARNLGSYLGRVLYPNGPVSALSSTGAALATGGSTFMSSGNPLLTAAATVAPMMAGAAGRAAASKSAKGSADYASAYLRNKGAGTQFAPAVEAPPIIKALPNIAGRTAVSMGTVAPAIPATQR